MNWMAHSKLLLPPLPNESLAVALGMAEELSCLPSCCASFCTGDEDIGFTDGQVARHLLESWQARIDICGSAEIARVKSTSN
jgi:hypothetical protein